MARQRIGYFEDRGEPEKSCSRCRMCELMCAFRHHHVGNPKRSRIRVTSLGRGVDIPVTCLNCEDPPCMNVCPTGALSRNDRDAMVMVNDDLCIGCTMCVNACPAGAVFLDPVEGVARKCDLCGGDPQCVKYCPAGVLQMTTSEQVARYRRKAFAMALQKGTEAE